MPLVNQRQQKEFNTRGPFDNTLDYKTDDRVSANGKFYVAPEPIPAGEGTPTPGTNRWIDDPGSEGEIGETGTQGDSVKAVYTRSATAPAAPTGTYAGGIFTVNAPWETTVPSGTKTLYRADATLDTVANKVTFSRAEQWTGPIGPEPSDARLNALISPLLTAAINASSLQNESQVNALITAALLAGDYTTQAVVQRLINNVLQAVTDASIFAEALFSVDRATWHAQLASYRYVWLRKIEEDRNTDNPEVVIDLGIVAIGDHITEVHHDDTLTGTGADADNLLRVAKPAADTGAQKNPFRVRKWASIDSNTDDSLIAGEIGLLDASDTQIQTGDISRAAKIRIAKKQATFGTNAADANTELDTQDISDYLQNVVDKGGSVIVALSQFGQSSIVYFQAEIATEVIETIDNEQVVVGWELSELISWGSYTPPSQGVGWNIVGSLAFGNMWQDIINLAEKLAEYVKREALEGSASDQFASYDNALFGANYFPGNWCLFNQTTEPTDDTNAIRQPDIASGSGVLVWHLRDDSDPNKSWTPETLDASLWPNGRKFHITPWSPYKPNTFLEVALTTAATLVGTDNQARLWAQAAWVETGEIGDVLDDGDYFRFSENKPSQLNFDLPVEAIPGLIYQYAKLDGTNVSDALIAAIQGDNEAVTLSETFRVDTTNVNYYVQITPAGGINTQNTIRIRLPSSAANTQIDRDLKRLLKRRAWVKIGDDFIVNVTTNHTRSIIGTSLTFNFNYGVVEGAAPTGSTPVSLRVVGNDTHRGELALYAFIAEKWNTFTEKTTKHNDDLVLVADSEDNYEVKVMKISTLTA